MATTYTLGCDLSYEIQSEAVLIFNIEVAQISRHMDLTETLSISAGDNRRTYTHPASQNRILSLNVRPGPLHVRYRAEVTLDPFYSDTEVVQETSFGDLPLEIMPFLLPTRFVSSDRLAAFARREFGNMQPGHSRVTAICNWIYENIDYKRGSSDEQTTADESLILRAGVCRDFAHLGIAFCRALNIPARFVSCYAHGLNPADFHAVFEAHLDGRWWLFDATRQAHLDGLVRIGIGRDAAEVPFASSFGEVAPGPVKIMIERNDGVSEDRRTLAAVSTD